MQTISDHRKMTAIGQFNRNSTKAFWSLPAERKRLVLERLGDVITTDKIKAAVADVNGKRKTENRQ